MSLSAHIESAVNAHEGITIELRKGNFRNKGSAMMLAAAVQMIERRLKSARICMGPADHCPAQERARLGILERVSDHAAAEHDRGATGRLDLDRHPGSSVVAESEVDAVLDLAGFNYADEWGPEDTEALALVAQSCAASGAALILLPQALGPFATPRSQHAIRTVAMHARLIFARDEYSLSHIKNVVGERANILTAPDFTNLLSEPEHKTTLQPRTVILVPNIRVVDRNSDPDQRFRYLRFLSLAVRHVSSAGFTPVFLLQDDGPGDREIVDALLADLDGPLPEVRTEIGVSARPLIAGSIAVIGSRYHALVSALSQRIPAISVGWTHKYRALVEDYDCPDTLCELTRDTDETIRKKLSLIVDDDARRNLIARITKRSSALQTRTHEMWDAVFAAITVARRQRRRTVDIYDGMRP